MSVPSCPGFRPRQIFHEVNRTMDWLWNLLSTQLHENQFFSGGLILMLSGAAVALLRHIPGKIWAWIKERCIIEIDIPDRETAFEWLDKWLAAQAYSKSKA